MKKLFLIISGLLCLGVSTALAGPPPVGGGTMLPGPVNKATGEGTTEGSEYVTKKLAPKITNTIIFFILAISVLIIVVGGIMYIVSSGESEMVKKAKETIIWAIVGVVLSLLSYGIVKFFVGINFTGT